MSCKKLSSWGPTVFVAVKSLFITGLLLVPLAGAVAQDEAGSGGLLEQGFSKFQEGDLDGAIGEFEKAFAENPTNDLVTDFVEKASVAKIYRMVRSENPRVAGIGVELLRISTLVISQRGEDSEVLKTAVETVLQSENEEQLRYKIQYAYQLGRNLVPLLIPYLGDGEIAVRALVMNWIARIGMDALPPLVAACRHPDGRIRTNVAALLGARSLRHPYSLGYLKALAETDDLKEVRDEASSSLNAILADLDGTGTVDDAKAYFLQTAREFYLKPYRNPFDNRKYSPMVYELSGTQVIGTKVVGFQVSEMMATQCLLESLKLDPNYTAARVLNLCADAARLVEYDENASWYSAQDGFEDIKAVLSGQKGHTDLVVRNRLLSAPAPVLYAAIRQAALDGRGEVARKLIRSAHTIGLRGEVPVALVEALEDENSRLVRVAAAITLAYWNPESGFDAGEQVISILSNAVVQSGIRTVVKGMGNKPLANRFDALLRSKLNMESYLHETNVEELLHTLRKSPPDMVLVDEEIGYATVERATSPINTIVNELRKDYRTVDVPVVVVVEPGREEKAKEAYESDERKVWVIVANIGAVALQKAVVEPIFEGKDDSKTLATRLASEAAEALSYLSSVRTDMPVVQSVASLGQVLTNRPDSVRIPCLETLGNLRATGLLAQVAQVFSNLDNSATVRKAAMLAIGKALSASQKATDDILLIIKSGCAENDAAIRQASWIAFGRSGASAEDHLALIQSKASGAAPADAEAPEEEPAPEEDASVEEPGSDDLDPDGDI